jgi:2-polyprenyl-3-methyl-5-hydroxy-6-metoxy-1,4-benzoquinol methylase
MDAQLMKAMLDVDERHWWYRGRREIIRAELEQLPLPTAGARLLDAGCGSGRTLEELERYGDVCGIDVNSEAADAARARGHEVVTGPLEQLPWEAARFDVITCLDVIEHLPDERPAMLELARVCKPEGWMVLTVPAYPALWSHHDEANHHYRRYSRRTLRAAVAGAGWRIERMTSFNTLLLGPAAMVRVAERRLRSRQSLNGGSAPSTLHLGPAWFNAALEAPLRLEARWLAGGRRLAAGLSLLAVLRRTGSDS